MVLILSSKIPVSVLLQQLKQVPARRPFQAYRFCGVLQLIEEPLAYQKRIRDEWK